VLLGVEGMRAKWVNPEQYAKFSLISNLLITLDHLLSFLACKFAK
jgi:hypothetical protein